MTFPFYDYDSDFFSTEDLLFLAGASGKAVEDTATGNPLVFTTDLARPLKSLLIPFTPVQSGTGDPSPQNIRPIVPWDGLNVGHCGKNMFNGVRENGYISDNGVIGSDGYNYHSELIRVEAGEKYTYSLVKNNASVSNKRVHGYGLDGEWVQLIKKESVSQEGNIAITFTVPNGVYFIRVQFYGEAIDSLADTDIQIEQGETATTYESYNGTVYPVSFPSHVYGGTLDVVSGELWATYSFIEKKWSDGIIPTVLGDYTRKQFGIGREPMTAQASKATERFCNIAPWLVQYNNQSTHYYFYQSGEGEACLAFVFLPSDTDPNTKIQLAVALKNPVLVGTLTPAQITALLGDNTIWSDADGSMTAVYLKKG